MVSNNNESKAYSPIHAFRINTVVRLLISFIKIFWPIGIFLCIYLAVFSKVFLAQLIPFPGDLLVSRFFPYMNGGWQGFSPWITYKQFILADVVRQIYPWRILSMDLLKHHILPLWNIYSFSGNPLLANLQSAVFYPLNIIFFFAASPVAWVLYIMVQPILAALFTYLFIRSLHVSRLAGTVAGIGYAFIGYVMVWFEMGTIGHAALWLPLILWGLTRYLDTKKTPYLISCSIGIACSLLAGNAQTSAYVLIFSLAYFFWMGWRRLTVREGITGLFFVGMGIALASIQIIPSFELMMYSARDALSSTRTFHQFITPWSHIAMLFAPDYFGNPATGNFWGKDYGEFLSYSGIVVLLLAAIGMYSFFQKRIIRLLLAVASIALLIAFPTPFPDLLFQSHIPILSTGLPSRTLFLLAVCLVIASAYGVEAIRTVSFKKILPPIGAILAIYLFLWISIFVTHIDSVKLAVTKRNLLLPTGIILLASTAIMFRKFTKHFFVLWIILFACMGVEYSYYWNKYLPFAPMQYVYPPHELVSKIVSISDNSRVYGYDTANILTNFPVQWRVLSPEGYDPLYIKSYAELMYAGRTGKLETDLPRADAIFAHSLPAEDSYAKQTLMNILGVRYVLDKDDLQPKYWDPRPDRFPTGRFKLIYQNYKWKIYENIAALPRAAVFYHYEVIPQPDKSIQTVLHPPFDYTRTLILEKNPLFTSKTSSPTPATITSYTADNVIIHTETKQNGLLFLSDNNYPGWNAYVDGKSTPILHADYSFRAVEIPQGIHEIRFEYQPFSFYIGAGISLVSLMILCVFVMKKVLMRILN